MTIESFDSPDSSTIAGAEYHPESRELRITFKRKGFTVGYLYAGFPLDMWEQFDAATSKGAFFGRHIRPLYSGVEV